jgi:O-antigen/teichoic acid export membrane protein
MPKNSSTASRSLLLRIRDELAQLFLGQFFRGVAILAGGTALAQILTVLASPLLARLYEPQDFGVMSIYLSMVSIISGVGCWRYEVAVALPEDDEAAVHLLALCVFLLTGMALLSWGAVTLWGSEIVWILKAPLLAPYLWLMPISVMAIGTYQMLNYWGVRKKVFSNIARSKFIQSVTQVLVQSLLGLSKAGPIGLLLGDVAGRCGSSLTLASVAVRRIGKMTRTISPASIRTVAIRYRRFPLYSTWAALINSIGVYALPLLMSAHFGPKVSGWLALCQIVAGAPLSLISTSATQIYMAEAARIQRSNLPVQLAFFWSTVRRLALLAFVMLSAVAVSIPWLIPTLFGDNWSESVRYIYVLTPAYFSMAVGSSVFGAVDVFERQDLALMLELTRIPLMVGPILVGGFLGWSPIACLALYSAGTSTYYMLGTANSWYAINSARLVN